MQSILSKVGLENGYTRRISVALFGDIPAAVEEPAINGRPAVPARDAHSGAAFVLTETSPAAVSEYASLRTHGKTPGQAFAQAFVNYFHADHDVTDLQAAAANFESSADYAAVVESVNTDAETLASRKAAADAVTAAKNARALADAATAAAEAAEAQATALQAAAS